MSGSDVVWLVAKRKGALDQVPYGIYGSMDQALNVLGDLVVDWVRERQVVTVRFGMDDDRENASLERLDGDGRVLDLFTAEAFEVVR